MMRHCNYETVLYTLLILTSSIVNATKGKDLPKECTDKSITISKDHLNIQSLDLGIAIANQKYNGVIVGLHDGFKSESFKSCEQKAKELHLDKMQSKLYTIEFLFGSMVVFDHQISIGDSESYEMLIQDKGIYFTACSPTAAAQSYPYSDQVTVKRDLIKEQLVNDGHQISFAVCIPDSMDAISFEENLKKISVRFHEQAVSGECNVSYRQASSVSFSLYNHEETDNGLKGILELSVNPRIQGQEDQSDFLINSKEFGQGRELAIKICERMGYTKGKFVRYKKSKQNTFKNRLSFMMRADDEDCKHFFEDVINNQKFTNEEIEERLGKKNSRKNCLSKKPTKQPVFMECSDPIQFTGSYVTQSSSCDGATNCYPGMSVRIGEHDHLCLPNRCSCSYGLPPEIDQIRLGDFCGINKIEEQKLHSNDLRLNSMTSNRSRIFNGFDTDRATWPFVVPIYEERSSEIPFCGAGIISQRFLVTAAHCFYQSHDLQKKSYVFAYISPLFIESEELIEHPDYNEHGDNNYDNDIGLIRMSQVFDFDDNYRPVCLQDYYVEDNMEGWLDSEAILSSYGAGKQIAQASFLIQNPELHDECELSPHKICAQADLHNGAVNTCGGDSGSPLMMSKNAFINNKFITRWSIIGLVSMGPSKEECEAGERKPTVFTNVAFFTSWIKSVLESFTMKSYCVKDGSPQCALCETSYKLDDGLCITEINDSQMNTFYDFFQQRFCSEDCTQYMKMHSFTTNPTDPLIAPSTYNLIQYNECHCSNGEPLLRCESEVLDFCDSCKKGYEIQLETIVCEVCVDSRKCTYKNAQKDFEETEIEVSYCHKGFSFTRRYCEVSSEILMAQCNSTYHYDPDRNNCYQNKCSCPFGTVVNPEACFIHEGHSCILNTCHQDEVGPIAIQIQTDNGPIECIKECICNFGKPLVGDDCPRHGDYGCYENSCFDGYDSVSFSVAGRLNEVYSYGFDSVEELTRFKCELNEVRCHELKENDPNVKCKKSACFCDLGEVVPNENCKRLNAHSCQTCTTEGADMIDSEHGQMCILECECEDGLPVEVDNCPGHGYQSCRSCDEGYGPVRGEHGMICKKRCRCPFGEAVDNCDVYGRHNCTIGSCRDGALEIIKNYDDSYYGDAMECHQTCSRKLRIAGNSIGANWIDSGIDIISSGTTNDEQRKWLIVKLNEGEGYTYEEASNYCKNLGSYVSLTQSHNLDLIYEQFQAPSWYGVSYIEKQFCQQDDPLIWDRYINLYKDHEILYTYGRSGSPNCCVKIDKSGERIIKIFENCKERLSSFICEYNPESLDFDANFIEFEETASNSVTNTLNSDR